MKVGTGDTPPAFTRRWRAMIMERPGAERLAMGCAMFDASRALLRAGIRERGAAEPRGDERGEILRRTYPELDARTVKAVVQRLG